jgi:hypothetical protein
VAPERDRIGEVNLEAARDREGEVNRSERHAVDDQEFWLGNIRELRGHFYRTTDLLRALLQCLQNSYEWGELMGQL